MKKKLVALVLVTTLLCGVTACGNDKKEPAVKDTPVEESAVANAYVGETSAEIVTETSPTEIATEIETTTAADDSAMFQWLDQFKLEAKNDFGVVIDGVSYGFPLTPQEFIDNGWEVQEHEADKVVNPQVGDSIDLTNGYGHVFMGILNLSEDKELPATECYVTSISVMAGTEVPMKLHGYDIVLGEEIEVTDDMFGNDFTMQKQEASETTVVYTFNQDDPSTGFQIGGFILCVEDGKLTQLIAYSNAFGLDFGG